MTYFLTGDEWRDDPIWDVLARVRKTARARKRLIQALKAGHQDLFSAAAAIKADGYLTREIVERYCEPEIVALLASRVLDRAPRLHVEGDECSCLGDAPWIKGYDYRLHRFLKRNPSRKEIDRRTQQKAELNDAALKHRVWLRDGGCCRYCGSGILNKKSGRNRDLRKVLTFDHRDPDQTAGPDDANLLTCCKRCNTYKGHRLPEEADMVVLPIPTEAVKAEWEQRQAEHGPAVFDLPLQRPSITGGSTIGSTPDQQQPVDPPVDPNGDPDDPPITAHTNNTTAQVYPETSDDQADQPVGEPGKCPARVGQPPPADPSTPPRQTQPPRTPDAPDIYHGRSRPAPTIPTRPLNPGHPPDTPPRASP